MTIELDRVRAVPGDLASDARYAAGMTQNVTLDRPVGPTPPWPPYAPPQRPRRSGLWVAVLAAVVLIAAAIVGGLVVLRTGTHAPAETAAAAPPPAAVVNPVDTTTCKAWAAVKPDMQAVPDFPEGWDWDTPGIDSYINTWVAVTTASMDTFEAQIADEPAELAAAARAYVAAQRVSVGHYLAHAYTAPDQAAVMVPEKTLNRLCGG